MNVVGAAEAVCGLSAHWAELAALSGLTPRALPPLPHVKPATVLFLFECWRFIIQYSPSPLRRCACTLHMCPPPAHQSGPHTPPASAPTH